MTQNGTITANKIRSVRLDDERLASVLDRLDDGPAAAGQGNRRGQERFPYRIKGAVVTFQPDAGGTTSFLVPTRDISSTGMCFLHGGFVHTKTRCLIQLFTTWGTWHQVEGSVARCRYVEGLIHEVGIQFDRSVDVAMFTPQAVRWRILLLDYDAFSRRLITFHLKQMNADVMAVDDAEKAAEQVAGGEFDCVLMDVDPHEASGVEVLRKIRGVGFSGAVAAVTSMTSSGDREQILEQGFDMHLPKPVRRELLEQLLRHGRQTPIYSSMSGTPEMDELIGHFVSGLPARSEAMESALEKANLDRLGSLTRTLRGDARAVGFEQLALVTEKLEEAIQRGEEQGGIRAHLKELGRMSSLARPPGSEGNRA